MSKSSPSLCARLKRWITRRKRLEGVPDLQRCLDELIKYSGYPVSKKVSAHEIALSQALLVHLERACVVLDKQNIPHPEIDRGPITTNHTEWIAFLSKLLARDDAR